MRPNYKLLATLITFVYITMHTDSLAQNVGINSTGAVPSSRAMLDIDQIGRGILIPRMTKARRDTITSIPTSLLVYQTDNTPGFYFYSGSAWVPFLTTATGWSLSGNTGTTAGTDYLGTTDAEDLVFSTAGTERIRINGEADGLVGFMGIGTTNPQQSLHVADDIVLGGGQDGNYDGATEHLKIWSQSKVWNFGVINDASSGNSDFFISQTDGVADGTFHIEPSGHVGIGTTTPDVGFELEGTSRILSTININRFSATINPPYLEFNKSRGGTKGDFTIVQDDDRLGVVMFSGADGTDFSAAAEISALVDQASPGNNDIQAELLFKTGGTALGNINMVIRASGDVGIGTTTPSRLFEVSGTGSRYARITSTTPNDVGIELMRSGAVYFDWRITNIGGRLRFQGSEDDYSAVSDVLTLETTGNVGIGTTNPDDELDVVGTAHISSYLKVGNPSTPATVSGSWTVLLSLDAETNAGWGSVDGCGICDNASNDWEYYVNTAASSGGYLWYDPDEQDSRKHLYLPWVWIPVGVTSVGGWIHHQTIGTMEPLYDGVSLEYSVNNGTTWTQVSSGSFTQDGYNGTATGYNQACSGVNSPSLNVWNDAAAQRNSEFSLTITGGEWIRFRFVGTADVGTDDGGYFRLYSFGLTCVTAGSIGGAFASGNIYAENNVYAGSNALIGDVAEYFKVDALTEPGDLISMKTTGGDQYTISNNAYNPYVIGIHSTNPTVTLNRASGAPVCLTGRVPVKVSGENGIIRIGDYLTAASVKGHSMKADKACYIIGRALEPFDEEGTGKILCLVEAGWYNPNSTILQNSGTFVIQKDKSSVKVIDSSIKQASRIFITMLADPIYRYWISEQEEGSFVLSLSGNSELDLPFNYFVDNANNVPEHIQDKIFAGKKLIPQYTEQEETEAEQDRRENSIALPQALLGVPPSNVPDSSRGYYWTSKTGFIATTESFTESTSVQEKQEKQEKQEDQNPAIPHDNND